MGLVQGLAFLALMTAPPPSVRTLAPAGKWVLDAEPGGCLLQREFGTGRDKLTFAIRRLPLTPVADILIFRPSAAGAATASGVGAIRYDGGGWAGPYRAVELKNGDWMATATLPAAELDRLARTTQVDVALGRGSGARLAETGLPAAIAAERSCEGKILAAWGIDPAETARVAVAAEALKPATWITDADYPKNAWTNGVVGRVVMLWAVDTSGRASDCRVVQSSGSPVLDHASCDLIVARARYRPAQDREGKAVPSHAARMFNWTLPY